MQRRRSIDLSIQLDLDAEPIAGRLRQGAGSARPFHGWLGLAAAIEDALTSGRRRPDSCEDRTGEITQSRGAMTGTSPERDP